MSSRLVPFGVAAAVLLLDRITKSWIEAVVSAWDTYVVIPNFFQIVHTQNRGAAFGLWSDGNSEWRGIFLVGLSLLVLVFLAGLLWQSPVSGSFGHRRSRLAIALVLGGALGNLHDRLMYGGVTDFLDFFIGDYHWPAFNLADSAITVGAGLLIVDLWRSRRQPVQA